MDIHLYFFLNILIKGKYTLKKKQKNLCWFYLLLGLVVLTKIFFISFFYSLLSLYLFLFISLSIFLSIHFFFPPAIPFKQMINLRTIVLLLPFLSYLSYIYFLFLSHDPNRIGHYLSKAIFYSCALWLLKNWLKFTFSVILPFFLS